MKKNTQKHVVNLKNNLISAHDLFSSRIKRVLIIIVFSFSFATISAQNGNSTVPKMMEVKSYLSSLKAENANKKVSVSNVQYVENLFFGIQPSIYYNFGVVKIYGEKPVKLFTDISSLAIISFSNLSKDDVEIVVINIKNTTDLNSKIDLAIFSNFINLKYIHIISSINTSEQNIANMFIHYNNQYSIFYKIEIAE